VLSKPFFLQPLFQSYVNSIRWKHIGKKACGALTTRRLEETNEAGPTNTTMTKPVFPGTVL